MRLTQAASKYPLQQQQDGCSDTKQSPNVAINSFPHEILLEIFDFYRQSFRLKGNHERDWNGKDGWFKLAHVCQIWRHIVFASPSRLHLRLIFTAYRSARTIMLKRLPPIPMVFDFSFGVDTIKKQNRMVSALKYRDRAVAVNFIGSELALERFLKALRHPFPALESLVLGCLGKWDYDLPNIFLQGSTQRLRRLKLTGVTLSSLSQLLSSTTGLIDLDLDIDTMFCPSPAASLPTYLQGMPSLRCLSLAETYPIPFNGIRSVPIMEKGDIISLTKLTRFHFSGYRIHLEGLLARLAAPSLQDILIQLYDHPPTPHILHLPRFIRDVERPAFSAEFEFAGPWPHMFVLKSVGEPPLRLIALKNILEILRTLSDMTATVEDLLFTDSSETNSRRPFARQHFPWRTLLGQFRNVKILRLRHKLVLPVAEFFRQRGKEGALNLLPTLERIELDPGGHDALFSESVRVCVRNNFQPFVAARERVGRPVYVFWNTDQLFPSISYDALSQLPLDP